MERRLAAIPAADVFGYSRLMGEDEEATLRTLFAYRIIMDSLIDSHRGRFVNSAGDSVLAEFNSVVDAVNCAVEIQTGLKAENTALPSFGGLWPREHLLHFTPPVKRHYRHRVPHRSGRLRRVRIEKGRWIW